MKIITRLLLGTMLPLSMVFAWAKDLPAEIVKGEVKYVASEAQLFSLRANDGKVLLVSWDKKTVFRNLKDPASIKPDDYLIVDFSLQGEQVIAATVAMPEKILPPGILETSLAMIDRFVGSSAGGELLTLVDVRLPEKFDAGHIPGAISVPLTRIVKRTPGLLPDNKNAVIVFYDDGAEIDAAVKAAELTVNNGYPKVQVFKEGVRGWVNSGRFLASSPTFVRKNKQALIDLRSVEQVLQGHIEGAVNFPLTQLARMADRFPARKRVPVVVYGENDRDALAGAAMIRSWGFKNVTFFHGGTSAWLDSAEALVSGPVTDKFYSDEAAHGGQLQPADFEKALQSPASVELVDVRSEADYLKGNLQKGVHIPLQSLALRFKELTRGKIQVVFAADAERAEMAYDFLKARGYRVNFIGGAVEISSNGEYRVR